MAFPPNAQLSANDLSALAGVTPEQLAIIARAMQSGALPFPPNPPAPTEFTPAAAPHSSLRSQLPDQPRPVPSNVTYQNAVAARAETDVEEGEVDEEEGEAVEGRVEGDFLRPPPTGPRNGSTTPNGGGGRSRSERDISSGSHQALSSASARRSGPSAHDAWPGSVERQTGKYSQYASRESLHSPESRQPAMSSSNREDRDATLKPFLAALFDAGYTHDQVAAQVSDPNALRELTIALGLPRRDSKPVPQAASQSHPAESQSPLAAAPAKTASVKKPTLAKASPAQNRSEYLAKLQAAKNKKTEVSANAAGPATQPKKEASTRPLPPKPQATKQTTTSKILSGAKAAAKAAKDELLRQRLEAIRTAKSTKQSTPITSSSPMQTQSAILPSLPPGPFTPGAGLGSGLAEAAQQVEQVIASPPQPTPRNGAANLVSASATTSSSSVLGLGGKPQNSSITPPVSQSPAFSGLPGLFMTGAPAASPSQQPPVPGPFSPAGSLSAPQRTPPLATASSETLDSSRKRTSQGDIPLAKRVAVVNKPFGQIRARDEPLIIQISEDEDDDDEMDISDSDEDAAGQPSTRRILSPRNTAVHTNSPRPNLQRSDTSSSAVTPAPLTPGQEAYHKKMQEIELMKRHLAKKEQLRLAKLSSKTDGSVPASVPTSGAATPNPQAANGDADEASQPPRVSSLQGSSDPMASQIPASGAAPLVSTTPMKTSARKQMEELQRRHDELKRQLGQSGPAAQKPGTSSAVAAAILPSVFARMFSLA